MKACPRGKIKITFGAFFYYRKSFRITQTVPDNKYILVGIVSVISIKNKGDKEMTIVEKASALIGPAAASHLNQIEAIVDMCKDEATQFCNLDVYSDKLDNAVVQMTIERYNRLNNEGISKSNASSIDESFIDGYSKSTLSMLVKNRKVRVLK